MRSGRHDFRPVAPCVVNQHLTSLSEAVAADKRPSCALISAVGSTTNTRRSANETTALTTLSGTPPSPVRRGRVRGNQWSDNFIALTLSLSLAGEGFLSRRRCSLQPGSPRAARPPAGGRGGRDRRAQRRVRRRVRRHHRGYPMLAALRRRPDFPTATNPVGRAPDQQSPRSAASVMFPLAPLGARRPPTPSRRRSPSTGSNDVIATFGPGTVFSARATQKTC